MPTLIEVTQNDIDTANDRIRTGNWDDVSMVDRCPVAIAASRAFGTPMRVAEAANQKQRAWYSEAFGQEDPEPGAEPDNSAVLYMHFKSRGFDHSADVRLPWDAARRIRLWDDDQFMSPFEFEVNA